MDQLAKLNMLAESTTSRSEALNILALVQHTEHRKKARREAYRAQWIEAHEIAG